MKLISVLGLAAFVCLSAVSACSTSDEGSGGDRGAEDAATSDADDGAPPADAAADVQKDTAPPPADCANHAPVSKIPACDTCTKGSCCDELLACDKNAKCKALQECLAACKLTDVSCGSRCQTTAGMEATDLLTDLNACGRRKCASDCSG